MPSAGLFYFPSPVFYALNPSVQPVGFNFVYGVITGVFLRVVEVPNSEGYSRPPTDVVRYQPKRSTWTLPERRYYVLEEVDQLVAKCFFHSPPPVVGIHRKSYPVVTFSVRTQYSAFLVFLSIDELYLYLLLGEVFLVHKLDHPSEELYVVHQG